jgi:hypothetical protein
MVNVAVLVQACSTCSAGQSSWPSDWPIVIDGMVLNVTGLWLTTTPSQASQLRYRQSIEVTLTYMPLDRVLYDSQGTVVSVDTTGVDIGLQNVTLPPALIPVSWNPRVGDTIQLTLH